MSGERDLLNEQRAYYNARAPEYDDWFMRRGRYDGGPEENRRWLGEVEVVREALRAFEPAGRILELACGTGWWTQELASYAGEITALDGSSEVIELNRRRLGGDPKVHYVLADIFEWEPTSAYDVVFFGFWLSHVPSHEFAGFWGRVRTALKPGGRVFFVDSFQRPVASRWSRLADDSDGSVEVRTLEDGREFRVVKIRYDPRHLQEELEALGWKARISQTEKYFIFGELRPGGAS